MSRTFWLVVGGIVLATGLLWVDKIEAGTFRDLAVTFFAGWQARRYGDNRLRAQNGGKV